MRKNSFVTINANKSIKSSMNEERDNPQTAHRMVAYLYAPNETICKNNLVITKPNCALLRDFTVVIKI